MKKVYLNKMKKKELVNYLRKTNEKSFNLDDLMNISKWKKDKVTKFLKQIYSLSISKKFLIRISYFDENNDPVYLRRPNQEYKKEYELCNLEYLSEERKLDLELAKLLLKKDFKWVRFDDYSELMLKKETLPYFSSNLNDSYKAIEILDNLFFISQIEKEAKSSTCEAITYNDPNKKDRVIASGKSSAIAITKCIIKFLKEQNESN